MNTEFYDKWIKSHQIKDDGIDITDAVMSRITEKVHKPNVFKRACVYVLLDLMQTKVLWRLCALACGTLLGILRMVFQIYSVLFT